MRVYSSLDEVDKAPSGRVVAIGVFDGVHRGHQQILNRAVQEAASREARSAAVTFYPHPEAVLRPRSAPRMLTSLDQKARLLEGLGLDELVVVRFDKHFAQLSPESFCRVVLSSRLGAELVVVGENFRFGRGGQGTPADLVQYGATHGFQVQPVPLVEEGGEIISSTRIRELLGQGRVAEAARLLGRPHRIEGVVLPGSGRGRALAAPTANLEVPREIALPRLGVYATRSLVDGGEVHPSVTSLGTNPTFESDGRVRIETLLLDYTGDLYGHHLAVDFLERIRGQKKFQNSAALAEQIKKDIDVARVIHGGPASCSAEKTAASS